MIGILQGLWLALSSVVFLPLDLMRSIPYLFRLWFTHYPFTRSEVMRTIAPIHGTKAARMYYSGLRSGFLHYGSALSGRHVFYSAGLRDGYTLRKDPSQWTSFLKHRASQ